MRFGIFYEHQLPRPWGEGAERKLLLDALDQVELADRVGFDVVWEVEHHYLEEYSHSSAPEVFLAAASQRTKRIRLGHGIVQLPPRINHPARIAERAATLDLISGGRVELGTGESSSAAELGGFLVDREDKRTQWEDMIAALAALMVETPFAGWDSRHLQMPQRNVVPKPMQKPHPPLWVACSRRDTIKMAATKGIGALSFSFVEPEDAKLFVDDYYTTLASDACVPAGFAVNANVTVVLPMMCHEDEQVAIDRGIDGAHFFGYSLAHYYGMGRHAPGRTNVWDEFLANRATKGFAREIVKADKAPLGVKILEQGIGSLRGAIGTPKQILELVRRYEAAGVDEVTFVLQAGKNRHEHICEALELFGREVIPRFAEERDAKEQAKRERLAPAIERAMSRRAKPRSAPAYVIDEPAEVARARSPKTFRRAARDGARSVIASALKGKSDAFLERTFGSSFVQRAIFGAMARAFDPRAAAGFEGAIVYELGGHDSWSLVVDKRTAHAVRGPHDAPAVRIRIGYADFARLLSGEEHPTALTMSGRIDADGDIRVIGRLGEMFGGPSAF